MIRLRRTASHVLVLSPVSPRRPLYNLLVFGIEVKARTEMSRQKYEPFDPHAADSGPEGMRGAPIGRPVADLRPAEPLGDGSNLFLARQVTLDAASGKCYASSRPHGKVGHETGIWRILQRFGREMCLI